MSEKKDQQIVGIVHMEEHFLYLPFYYAQSYDFFGYIPENYKINKPQLPPIDHTDENAFKALITSPDIGKDIHFAICDPIQILNPRLQIQNRTPVVLAALVTNSAFWAVDHDSHMIMDFKDLSRFDKIISYPKGTTSYNIAARLHKYSDKNVSIEEFIKTVPAKREIEELHKSKAGTVALSPNPFDIDDLIKHGKGEYKINLSLGATPEYSNVLVTGLISTSDFVSNHQPLVDGLLRAIQRAILLIRLYHENDESNNPVVTFAERYFAQGKNASGALRMALDSHVFPTSIEVNKVQWENAVRAANSNLTEQQSTKIASDSYASYINPYAHYARQAARDVIISKIYPTVEESTKISVVKGNTLLFLGILFFLGMICSKIFYNYDCISFTVISFLLYGFLITKIFKLMEHPKLNKLHIGLCCFITLYSIFLMVLYLYKIPLVEDPKIWFSLAVFGVFISCEVAIILKAIKN
ncbi:MAG TPA: hypothetical protein VJY62_15885 [Bacteroidia bacterium]|nr:hypothetical protein [Bacteroidia bacterium]